MNTASPPGNPLAYGEFRTGFTFGDVYYMIYNRKYKRRHGVLGYWHQLKQTMYERYLQGYSTPKHTVSCEPVLE